MTWAPGPARRHRAATPGVPRCAPNILAGLDGTMRRDWTCGGCDGRSRVRRGDLAAARPWRRGVVRCHLQQARGCDLRILLSTDRLVDGRTGSDVDRLSGGVA